MKKLKEFEYEIWTTEENGEKKYWVRVKYTDEITQVSLPVLRFLRCEEKRIRREKDVEREQGKDLSLNTLADVDTSEYWLADPNSFEDEIITNLTEEGFMKILTPRQLDIYLYCIVSGVGIREYAKANQMDHSSVRASIACIRKKVKKFFFDTPQTVKKCPCDK